MARRRVWSSLSEGYRTRLSRSGITRADYEAGIPLKAARGHRETPEHPIEAVKHPERFGAYRQRAAELQRKVKEKTLIVRSRSKLQQMLNMRKETLWSARHKWNLDRAVENILRKSDSPDGIQKIPTIKTMRMMLAASDEEWEEKVLNASFLANQGISDDWNALFYH